MDVSLLSQLVIHSLLISYVLYLTIWTPPPMGPPIILVINDMVN